MEPQTCTKCHELPEDILMLACQHDLCLNCASDRLAFQMKKKRPANSIVCQFCYERTPLDTQSVSQLQKLMNKKNSRVIQPSRRSDIRQVQKKDKYNYGHGVQPYNKVYDRTTQKTSSGNPNIQSKSYAVGPAITAKKLCAEHNDQQILYFCFDCKCQCICPQCVIHGRHKDHDVKTIKKSHPTIKNQMEKTIQKLENNIQSLLIRKSQVQKNLRTLTEQSSQSKRQIQQAFQEIRSKLDTKQKEILKTCDQSLEEGIQQLDKYTRAIVKRIDELKYQCGTTQQFLKKDELTALNYYAKKWKQLAQESKQSDVHISVVTFPSNQIILSSVLDLTDQIAQIGLAPQHRGKY